MVTGTPRARQVRHGQFIALSATVLPALSAGCATASGPAADWILRDAIVWTADSLRPRADAIVVSGGRLTYVGTSDSAKAWAGPRTRVLSLPGRMIIPGFHDVHVHPVTGGIELGECDLNTADSIEALHRIILECAGRAPATGWIRGGGWDLTLFDKANPSRLTLDSLIPDRPVYLTAADAHSAWVNSRALSEAGITRESRDPPGGRIERDAGGNPSGTLRESAMALVSARLPDYTDADFDAGLQRGLAMAARFGITTLHDASASQEVALAYARADSLDRLTARSILSLRVNTDAGVSQEVRRLAELRARTRRGLVRPTAAKIFLDGVIEGHTAALLEPYTDTASRGDLNLPPARLNEFVRQLDSTGFSVHVHAIGDRAIRTALDAFELQRSRDGGSGPRHIMAHIQLFHPQDIPRLAHMGVVASFQPLWAYADKYITELTEPKLGPARSRYLYPIGSVVRSGALFAAGSDWSVSSMDPLRAIQVGVTRRAVSDSSGSSWIPEERVDLETMLRAYTVNGAVASGHSDSVGMLRPGMVADVVVLSDDLFALPHHRIASARVLLTLLGGRETWRDSSLPRMQPSASP
jgi:predicted amidohydrolase YtcJ